MKKTIIIAGITRSGLTATMQMLDAGGYPCLGTYPAYEDHPNDGIDFEKEKGKAIKLVDTHYAFPIPGEYHVIRLKRNYEQQAKSICKLLGAIGLPVDDDAIKSFIDSFDTDYEKIDAWAVAQVGYLEIAFEELIADSFKTACAIRDFAGVDLDVDRMAAVIRKRCPDCYPTMMELEMI